MPIPYWRLSAYYACYFSTLGCFLPYWSLYLQAQHFDALAIGELSALLIGTKIIAPNFWGWLADRSANGLGVVRVTSFFAALLFPGFMFAKGFDAFAAVTIAFSFFWNASLPQFEALTVSYLSEHPQRYARIRLWGSVGFILSVLGLGAYFKIRGIERLPLMLSLLLALTWLSSLITPAIKTRHRLQAGQGLMKLLLRTEVLAFLLAYLLLQIAHAPYYVFYSIHLKQHAYSELMTGGLWTLGVVAEILMFMGAERLLRVMSLRQILLLSILLAALRWYWIAHYADNVTVMLAAQSLHAASFGSSHMVAVRLIQQYFGAGHPGKGQALYSSICFGIGGMLGGYLGGHFWETLGAMQVFNLASACCLLAFLVAFLFVGRLKTAAC